MFLNFDPTDDQKYTRSLVFDEDLPPMYYLIYLATTDEVKCTENNLQTSICQWLEVSVKLIKVTETYVTLNVFLMIQKFTLMAPS